MCMIETDRLLFTWEIGRDAEGRRWFYKKFKRLVSRIPERSFRKVGGSVYLVEERYADDLEELLSQFSGSEFDWQKFELRGADQPSGTPS